MKRPRDNEETDNDEEVTLLHRTIRPKSEVVDLTGEDDDVVEYSISGWPSSSQSIVKDASCRRLNPYYLTTVDEIPAKYNESSLSIRDLLLQEPSNPCRMVCLMNYMIDLDWLADECPWTIDCELLCLHGGKGVSEVPIHNEKWTIGKVDMGAETYGTHHSKLMLLFFDAGLRVVITTANFIPVDFIYRTQGVYVEDFPLKGTDTSATPRRNDDNDYESYLIRYLRSVNVGVRTRSAFHAVIGQLSRFDFSAAEVRLVGSSPGRHTGLAQNLWGIGRLHALLDAHHLLDEDVVPSKDHLVWQCSSLGSMGKDAALVSDYIARMTCSTRVLRPPTLQRSSPSKKATSNSKDENTPPVVRLLRDTGHVTLIWPTVRCVRESLQGYGAGNSLPCALKTLYGNSSTVLPGYRRLLRRWEGSSGFGRMNATPHMKCYFRYRDIPSSSSTTPRRELRWMLLTSQNLSQAAWGVYQQQQTTLYIKSYELGVLYLAGALHRRVISFSCTPNHPLLGLSLIGESHHEGSAAMHMDDDYARPPLRLLVQESVDDRPDNDSIHFPVPFQLPAPQYADSALEGLAASDSSADTEGDLPWTWDQRYRSLDRRGEPRRL